MIFAIGSYTLLMLASLVYAQASAAKLAGKVCASCHDTARICERLGKRTPEVWKQTVERMQGNGAQMSDAMIFAPSRARRTAWDLPCPRAAPVIKAT